MTSGPSDPRILYAICAAVDDPTKYPDPPGWTRVWTSIGTKGNAAAVFQQTQKVPLPIYALAIQGTHNALDILEDSGVNSQVPFPAIDGAGITGAAIAKGAHDAVMLVLTLKNTAGQTLRHYLDALKRGTTLVVTGHSLGGNVASVMLPWIAAHVPAFGPATVPLTIPANLSAVTFAAPSAGNSAFATFLNNQPNYAAYFNSNDVVSNVWATSGPLQVNNIYSLFPSPGPAPCPQSIATKLQNKMQAMQGAGVSYTQTNGTLFAFPSAQAPGKDETARWIWEMGYQHNDAYAKTYLGG